MDYLKSKRHSLGFLGAPANESAGALVDKLCLAKQIERLSLNETLSELPKIQLETINSESIVLEDFLPDRICRDLVVDYLPLLKIGEGAGAEVYKGRYCFARSVQPESDVPEQTEKLSPSTFFLPLGRAAPDPVKSSDWKPCAVKRIPKCNDSLIMALNEVYILYLLNQLSSNFITLVGIKEDAKPREAAAKPSIEQTTVSSPNSPQTPSAEIAAGSNTLRRYPTTLSLSRKRIQKLEEPCYYVVLDLATNGNLWQYVQQNKSDIGQKMFLRWARQLSDAVVIMHRHGIVHHDIKPQNILLDDSLNGQLCDFSCARFIPSFEPFIVPEECSSEDLESSSLTVPRTQPLPIPALATDGDLRRRKISLETTESSTSGGTEYSPGAKSSNIGGTSPTSSVNSLRDGLGRGTQAFSAPEILKIDGEYSTPVDIYSLGVTLYTLITGREPFDRARSGMEMIVGIRKGFFESGLQSPSFNSYQSAKSFPRYSNSPSNPLEAATHSTSSSSPFTFSPEWVFLNGEPVPLELEQLIKTCLSKTPERRPTAQQVAEVLARLD